MTSAAANEPAGSVKSSGRRRATPLPRSGAGNEGVGFEQAGALLTIDLAALRRNFRLLRGRLGGGECAGVVKADGYGLDGGRIATALQEEGCRHFFVAHAAEGLSLRGVLGPDPVIHVLNGIFPGAEDDCADAGLTAVANSRAQLAAWREAAARRGESLQVTVQVDSGMSRLGMPASEVESLGAGDFDGLNLVLVMSHLACADQPASPANAAQRRAFEMLRQGLPAAPASLANSSGIFLGPDYHYDLARPGAALYGINPLPGQPNPMQAVVRLQAKVIQTRDLAAGAGVGYGYGFLTSAPFRAATIALGYADGWPRRAAAGAWLEGVRLPFAGRVSMDSIVLDVSALPRGRPEAGELVDLIGVDQSVDDVAALAGTIGYEILTGLGHRFCRRYEDASGPAGPSRQAGSE
jgi:alanine racemase